MVYEDPYSPFCLVAEKPSDAEEIHEYLELFCKEIGDMVVMRNDVYARFSHKAYNKGTALAEISRRLNIKPAEIIAGDHMNDLRCFRRVRQMARRAGERDRFGQGNRSEAERLRQREALRAWGSAWNRACFALSRFRARASRGKFLTANESAGCACELIKNPRFAPAGFCGILHADDTRAV